jgi:phospholipid N-methyltransferase
MHDSYTLFLKEFARDPKAIGAVCSSSRKLSDRIARHIQPTAPGYVVELGGGMGAITQALLLHGISPERLLVIERSARLVGCLRRRFPGIKIIHGDAANLDVLLERKISISAIVSGLPLRSLPDVAVSAITSTCARMLPPDGRLVQFTYLLGGASPWLRAGLQTVKRETVWNNFPPAKIEVLQTSN